MHSPPRIRSTVSCGSDCAWWSWSERDYISEYYNGDKAEGDISPNQEYERQSDIRKNKLDHRIQYRFNSETNCFEEIQL